MAVGDPAKQIVGQHFLGLDRVPAAFQPREIEQVADFLFAKVIGKGPMDRAKCIEYWGSDVDTCKEFAK